MAKKAKLPKKVLGVRVPKRLRKGPLAELLLSPAGQGVMGAALTQLGMMLAKQAGDSKAGKAAQEWAKSKGSQAIGQAGSQASLLQHALAGAFDHFLATMRSGDQTIDKKQSGVGAEDGADEVTSRGPGQLAH